MNLVISHRCFERFEVQWVTDVTSKSVVCPMCATEMKYNVELNKWEKVERDSAVG